MIAAGIGLHNFSEGLAIGQSAAAGEISLALVLVIGFGLHNATEGFGIVGPFSGDRERPSWGFLVLVGLIGGGPTFFGTLLGQAWVSEAVSIAFLALAAGSILYVVIELLGVCRSLGHKTVVAWGLTLGLDARLRDRLRARRRRRLSGSTARRKVRRLPWAGAARIRLPARLLTRGRAALHLRGAGRRRARVRSCRCGSAAAPPVASSSRSASSRRRGSCSPRPGRCSTRSRRRSSTWRSGSPTTTARRRRARSSSSHRSAGHRAGSDRLRPSASRSPVSRRPRELTAEQGVAVARVVAGLDGRRARTSCSSARPGAARRRCTSRRARRHSRAASARSCSCRRSLSRRRRSAGSAQRFGDTVAILHSALGQAERRDERDRIARGEARMVVGARSAIFAPMRDLGLVIVDEEHDASYKQESDPRYDARTVAAKRAALEGAVAVYGSATPRPESWAHARADRALGADRGADAAGADRRSSSRERLPALGAAPDGARPGCGAGRKGDPAAQPARGDARDPLSGLRRCRVAAELRRRADVARRRRPALPSLRLPRAGPETCPGCGSAELAHIGAGTQRLEQELERNVPELERIRLDADTAARPGALREAIARFRGATAPC